MSHKLQVFLQFFLHNLDFAHFFALHFLLHFFEGQMSSQVAENVKNLSFGIKFNIINLKSNKYYINNPNIILLNTVV